MNELLKKIRKAKFIWVCGNGGSASTAEHFVTDLVKKGYPAFCLSSNMSLITMLANDYGYDKVFSKQLQVYAQQGDLLVTITCSGTSANVLSALIMAVNMDLDTFQFETFDKVNHKDYGLLEDRHLKIAHEVCKEL